MQRGATAIIFDITDHPEAATEVNKSDNTLNFFTDEKLFLLYVAQGGMYHYIFHPQVLKNIVFSY